MDSRNLPDMCMKEIKPNLEERMLFLEKEYEKLKRYVENEYLKTKEYVEEHIETNFFIRVQEYVNRKLKNQVNGTE